MATPHSTSNYTIGKGVLSFKKEGVGSAYVDLGNAPTVDLSIESEFLEHYSSREGIKTMDLRVPVSRKATLKVVLDEIAPENLAIALYGTYTAATSGGSPTPAKIDGMKEKPLVGELKLVGSNDIGVKYTWEFKNVTIAPSGTLSLIGDDWMEIELEASVGADSTGAFFSVTEN